MFEIIPMQINSITFKLEVQESNDTNVFPIKYFRSRDQLDYRHVMELASIYVTASYDEKKSKN